MDTQWFIIDDIYNWLRCRFWNCGFYEKKEETKKEEPKPEPKKQPEPEKPKEEPKKPEPKPENKSNNTNATKAKPEALIDANDLIAVNKSKKVNAISNATSNATKSSNNTMGGIKPIEVFKDNFLNQNSSVKGTAAKIKASQKS